MKRRAARRRERVSRPLCLECDFCRSAPEFERGADYVCIRFGKPLPRAALWRKGCRHFLAVGSSGD